MYSPKIDEELIPVLYDRAKSRKIPMTELVSELLRESLLKEEALNYRLQTSVSNHIGSTEESVLKEERKSEVGESCETLSERQRASA